jgi:hypothetical protein
VIDAAGALVPDLTRDDMFLSGADDAPTKYRPLVDEYFRALSRGTRGAGPVTAFSSAPSRNISS